MRVFRDNLTENKKIFQIVLIVLILSLSYLILSKLSFAYSSFLWAITFYFTLNPVYKNLTQKKKWNKYLASSFLVLILLLFISLILLISYFIVSSKIMPLLNNPEELKSATLTLTNNIQNFFSSSLINLNIYNHVVKLLPEVANHLIPLIKNIGTIILDMMMILIMFYIFLIYDKEIKDFIGKSLPFKKESVDNIFSKFENLVRGNMISIPLVALTQGIFGVIGYYLFGVSIINSLIFGFLTAITSILPVVGTAVVYLPLGLYIAFLKGSLFNGIGIILWGFLIIGFMDNLARVFFQKKMSQISGWYTILGSIVGIQIFGLSGIIFGPILLMLIIYLWKLYYRDFGFYKDNNI